MKSITLTAALAAVAAASTTTVQASPLPCGGEGATMLTDVGGPQVGQACVFPFTYNGQTYTSCVSVNDVKPVATSGSRPFQSTDQWCATAGTYNTGAHANKWGFCPKCATDSTTAPVTVSEDVTYLTQGGYVPNNSPCYFTVSFTGGKTYSGCIPFAEQAATNKGSGSTGVKPTKPANGKTDSWCWVVPSAMPSPPSGNVVYDTLSKADRTSWGYCNAIAPTAAPTTAPKTFTSGGYSPEGTTCTLPFNYKNPKTNKKTLYTTCAPTTGRAPFVSKVTPPADPTPPNTKDTWCFTGQAGTAYDPSSSNKQQWGYCATPTSAPIPFTTSAPTKLPTAIPSAQPTKRITPAPVVTVAPTGTRAPTTPTATPTSAAPSTARPTLVTARPTTVAPTTVAPSALPTSAMPTLAPTTNMTIAPHNDTNVTTRAPTVAPSSASLAGVSRFAVAAATVFLSAVFASTA